MIWITAAAVTVALVAAVALFIRAIRRSEYARGKAEILNAQAQQEQIHARKATEILAENRTVDDTVDRLRKSDF